MLVSVVIKTRAEAPRLRLVLASLERQKIAIVGDHELPPRDGVAAEIVVVNDGADAATAAVLDESPLPVRRVDLNPARGRSAASNAGARSARGDWLLFLDGDTLAAPGLVARHAAGQREVPGFLRGETYNLRCTRFFADPETGLPRPGCEEHAKRMQLDLPRRLVTREQVLERFEEIEARSQPGIYPGAGPRRLFELEWDALQNHPDLDVLWMAASGNNVSVRRVDFNTVGGFDERLAINEHRELALRLQAIGVRVRPVAAARSYHLTHRLGWRDPLLDREWERIIYSANPCPAVRLMTVFWQSLAGDEAIPLDERILSLPEMDAAARKRMATSSGTARCEVPSGENGGAMTARRLATSRPGASDQEGQASLEEMC